MLQTCTNYPPPKMWAQQLPLLSKQPTQIVLSKHRGKQLQFRIARILQDLLDPKSKSLGDFSSVGAKEV